MNQPKSQPAVPPRPPSLDELEAAAGSLLEERVLSKGGLQPSQEALRMVKRLLALRAQRELRQRQEPMQTKPPG